MTDDEIIEDTVLTDIMLDDDSAGCDDGDVGCCRGCLAVIIVIILSLCFVRIFG